MSETTKSPTPQRAALIAGVLVAAIAIGAGGYWLGVNRTQPASQTQEGRRVLYWYDPMVPDQHFDHSGKSPFMDMQLVPRYAGETPEAVGVRIDPGVTQNLGVRLAAVERAPLARSVVAAGVLAFNERNAAIVQARAGGFVERSYGRAVGDVVAAGTPIVDIRVPEWTAAQAEYLALRGAGGDLAQAARRRLSMLGMPPSLIDRVERDGAAHPITTVTAPIAGAITTLDIRQGMSIMTGAPLATISGVSPVWLIASLPQADASIAQRGGRVVASVPAYPGESFEGRIESVLPAANAATRTVEVRIALPNPRGRLRPGMTAEARLQEPNAQTVLLVPAEAVIRTGERNIVIVVLDGGRYVPVEVALGRAAGDRLEIRSGLQEGQNVVASGQFLIDSEASLSGVLARLQTSSATPSAPANAQAVHQAIGRIIAINAQGATIDHGPVPSLDWPAMRMQFAFARPEQARGLAVGDAVTFRFRQGASGFVIEEISKSGAPR